MNNHDVFHEDDLAMLQRMLGREEIGDQKLCEHYLRRLRFFHAGAQLGGPIGAPALAALLDNLGYESPHERTKKTPPPTDWSNIPVGRYVNVKALDQEWTGVYAGHVNGLLVVVAASGEYHEVMPCYATLCPGGVPGVLTSKPQFIDPEPPEPRRVPTPDVDAARAAEAEDDEDDEVAVEIKREPAESAQLSAYDDGRDPEKVDDPTSDEDELVTGWRKVKPGARCIFETNDDIVDAEYICVSPDKDGELMVRNLKTNEICSVIVDAVQLADDEPVAVAAKT